MHLPAPFDLATGAAMLVLVLYGLTRGIVRLVLGFAGLALGWAAAVRYCEPLAARIGAAPVPASSGPDLRRMLAFTCILIGVSLAASVAAWLVELVLGAVKLRGLDRLMGAGVGLLLAIVLVCAATVPLLALWPPDGGAVLRGSVLAPYAVAGGDYLKGLAPETMRRRFAEGARKVLSARAAGQELWRG